MSTVGELGDILQLIKGAKDGCEKLRTQGLPEVSKDDFSQRQYEGRLLIAGTNLERAFKEMVVLYHERKEAER